nr:RNA-directed DNA polymerase, eukaryota, reverse transcriptase zinc-binding domain protein [Tanacetum cinerariifolium]
MEDNDDDSDNDDALINDLKRMKNWKQFEIPPGFTPINDNVNSDGQSNKFTGERLNNIQEEVLKDKFNEDAGESTCSGHFKKSDISRTGGSILQVMEEMVKETKMENIDLFSIKRCWGNLDFDYVHSASIGNSGVILSVWDPKSFSKINATISDYFVMVRGVWIPNGTKLLIISIYAPQDLIEKKMLWDYLSHVIAQWAGDVVVIGDFNEVPKKVKRFGSVFNKHGANAFNLFISNADKGCGDVEIVNKRANVVRSLQELENLQSLEAAQKSKIKWSIEGDENSKYFHRILNKKRSQLAIRGILVDGNWIDSSHLPDQIVDLECDASKDEIKGRFGIVFPKGSNSSFIALIPKTRDAKMVKDFRPISLIGSMYKIIAKILANRLVLVSGDLDYLDDILRRFGFGDKWCSRIPSCLRSSRGSVIVNCSPTEEFQFHKGRLNMSKSKLMGIYVDADKVAQAARKIGCVTLKTPFTYLGSNVGGRMSRIHSWNEMIEAMASRLSKWKMKTLSIGGRLTLLKSVLPIYHMSIFKVPMKILQRMESIRSHFFNGSDSLAKKLTWVKWTNVLASKEKGGLGISSLYALNRALMFKRVWRFLSQNSSLWENVIKSIHGDHEKIGKQVKASYPSIWLDIVEEVDLLKKQGLNLLSFVNKKLGNGSDTLLAFTFRREPRGGVEQDQFDSLKAMVEGISLVNIRDRWIWSLQNSRDFTVTSIRKLIDEFTLSEVSSSTRWIKAVPIKAQKNQNPEAGQTSMAQDGSVFIYDPDYLHEQFVGLVIQRALPFNHFDHEQTTRVFQNAMQPRYTH